MNQEAIYQQVYSIIKSVAESSRGNDADYDAAADTITQMVVDNVRLATEEKMQLKVALDDGSNSS